VEFADVLIGLLRDPVKYEVRPVGGPGRPGSLTIKGRPFDIERIYAPPPDPPVLPGDELRLDARGLPILIRYTDAADMPFAWVDPYGQTYPSGCVIPPHVPVAIQLGQMWRENWRSAQSAQRQLRGDIDAIERRNDLQRAANQRVLQALGDATGQRLPADRSAWCAWWFSRIGRTYTPDTEPPRPASTEIVPLDYLPRDVGGLGFDPSTGYKLRVPTFRQ
jgi:hypothetical protein